MCILVLFVISSQVAYSKRFEYATHDAESLTFSQTASIFLITLPFTTPLESLWHSWRAAGTPLQHCGAGFPTFCCRLTRAKHEPCYLRTCRVISLTNSAGRSTTVSALKFSLCFEGRKAFISQPFFYT